MIVLLVFMAIYTAGEVSSIGEESGGGGEQVPA